MTTKTRAGHLLPYLSAWRVAKYMSHEKLAAASGVSKSAIIYLEAGKHPANLSTIAKLAEGLAITPDELVNVDPAVAQKNKASD